MLTKIGIGRVMFSRRNIWPRLAPRKRKKKKRRTSKFQKPPNTSCRQNTNQSISVSLIAVCGGERVRVCARAITQQRASLCDGLDGQERKLKRALLLLLFCFFCIPFWFNPTDF